jgi:hypothetical protein
MTVLAPPAAEARPRHVAATPILDHEHREVRGLAELLARGRPPERLFVQAAHRHVRGAVSPIYSLDDLQPASETLRRGRGSCSQRMAVLEAVCRARGIGTRVRGLWVDGRFWYPRFRAVSAFLPPRVVLAWPQFLLAGAWVDFDELFGPAESLAAAAPAGFANDGETLFEAVEHTSVDFLGKTCGAACATTTSLQRWVVGDAGIFDARDDLFAAHGGLSRTWRGFAFQAIFAGRKSA